MTVTEAASLVMKASRIAEGGETFWLDMGPQVRIGDLVDRLMRADRSKGLRRCRCRWLAFDLARSYRSSWRLKVSA